VRHAAFALDTRTVSLPALRRGADRLTLFDEKYGVVYRIERTRRQVAILRREGNRGNARIALMRVVRELAMNEAAARGGLLVHGGAFLLGSKAVIISGPKNSGKTTSLLQALARRTTRYISNDRLLVTARNGQLLCRGIPTIVTIRTGSLKGVPRLEASLRRSGYVSFITRREAVRRRRHGPGDPDRLGRYSISPSQLCGLLRTTAVKGGRPAAMIFPIIKRRAGGARIHRLSREKARQRIEAGLFRSGRRAVRGGAFASSYFPVRPSQPIVSLLANGLACFELELGRDAMTDASWIRRMTGLVGSRPRRRRK
jgi:hypothetical protein